MRIIAAQPCHYDYKTGEVRPAGEPVDTDTLAALNADGWEAVCRVEVGAYNRLIWHGTIDVSQHYLARVGG